MENSNKNLYFGNASWGGIWWMDVPAKPSKEMLDKIAAVRDLCRQSARAQIKMYQALLDLDKELNKK